MKYVPASRIAIFTLSFVVVLLSSCQRQVAKAPTVAPPPAAQTAPSPTVTLQASPNAITRGGSSTLSWSSSNATQVRLYPGAGNLGAQGSQRVSPSDTTVYTITATGPGGEVTADASISVAAPYSPPTASALTPEQMFQQMMKDAFFDYDKADLRSDAKEALTRDADFLRAHPEIRVAIEGHCDERGGEEYNLALGDRRAASTKQYLASLGISADRIQTVSLGKEQPFCTSESESCYQQNRRGHFALVR
jgi:peptidoglycan-associated lipoprotein